MIALDIDGVIANLYPEIIYRAKAEGFNVTEDIYDHDSLWEDLSDQITSKWVHKQFEDATFWLNAIPYEDAWYWINHHLSYSIVCLTKRPDNQLCQSITWRWFMEWDMPVDDIYHASDKNVVLNDIKPDIFVEDSFENATAAAEQTSSAVYLLNKKYNQYPDSSGLNRINSLWDIQL